MTEAFRNVEPRSRAERCAAYDKDKLEKSRIQSRGKKTTGSTELDADVLTVDKSSALFLDDSERFRKDAAAAEQQHRSETVKKKQVGLSGARTDGSTLSSLAHSSPLAGRLGAKAARERVQGEATMGADGARTQQPRTASADPTNHRRGA
jgi:hypothetical protein